MSGTCQHRWSKCAQNFGACQTEAAEKCVALPLTATIGKKGDECIAARPLVTEAIRVAEEKCAEDTRKLEEEQWRVKEEEENARKAAEKEELARKTAEATALARKIAEAGKKTGDTDGDGEQDGGDGEGDGESSEAPEKTNDTIIVQRKTGRMTAGPAPVMRHSVPCTRTALPKGKKAKAAATAAAPAPATGTSQTSGRKATSDRATVVSEDEDAPPRTCPGPRKGKRKAADIEEEEEEDLDEIDDALEREFAIWGAKYYQAEGIMRELKLEMDRVGSLIAKRRRIRK
ncbi:uncharacterized protein F5147DRAFT_655153 [Suillus discolor]|uniref:Uncharacterized protein n=1 Tax=Suillus discolor TaxID=1912936 RepID=A0A9P7JRP5_9AGAM|nr:uncharacterized protein F5147DRAFT_655153 [Suillus discolor]KAG2101828.1 hypothetical protein F5147DRAFT_655153 [Suillus discolor]